LAGCILALASRQWTARSRYCELLALIGVAAIATAVFIYDADTPFPGPAALLPILGAALVIYSGTGGQTLISRLLSTPPFVGLGVISYSLYLVHWPLIVLTRFATMGDIQLGQAPVLILASIALAYLSWRYIETPIRHSPRLRTPKVLWRDVAGGVAVCAALISFTPMLTPQALAQIDASAETHPTSAPGFQKPCFLENEGPESWRADACTWSNKSSRTALLWGDSFAAHYVPGLTFAHNPSHFNIIEYTSAGCPPLLDYSSYVLPHCHDSNQEALKIIVRQHVETVILSARWDLLRGARMSDLRSTLATLKGMGLKVYVIGVSPTFAFSPQYLAYREAGRTGPGEAALAIRPEQQTRNEEFRQITLASGATYIDVLGHFCPHGSCRYISGGQYLFADYGHYSIAGSIEAVNCCFPTAVATASDRKTSISSAGE